MITIKPIRVSDIWQKDERIERARKIIIPKINKTLARSKVKFDSQDLEHQILFRMTTIPEKEAFRKIDDIFQEQKFIVIERMKRAEVLPNELFYFGYQRKKDNHWYLKWTEGRKKLLAINKNNLAQRREVIHKEIIDEKEKRLLDDIIENYHYIHCSRNKNWLFGFFIKGNKLPFALEQVEECSNSRSYKKAILELLGLDPTRCVEIARFYTIPNTPRMIVGIRDKLATRLLKEKGFKWMITSVMPIFSKTKSTTIAGGLKIPIFAKELTIQFFERNDGRFEFCVDRKKERHRDLKTIKNVWKLFPVIEMLKPLRPRLKINLKSNNKIYYVKKE